jgi:HlyD family secretion protein
VLDAAGHPRAVPVGTGISDGTFVEIVSGDLKEGDAVIVSDGSAAAFAASPQQVNPFAPQFPRRR